MNPNTEVPVRLAPSSRVLRRIYSLSGNLCAFPECRQLMFDENGNFVGKVCHIEAAMPGGERFNSKMSNEDRRQFENLILMCEQHHIETDNTEKYTVEIMKQMKEMHERKYSEDIIEQKILNELRDYTKINSDFIKVESLEALFDTLDPEGNARYRRTIEEIENDVFAFNETIAKFLTLSIASRRVFLIALNHSHHPVSLNRENEEVLYVDFREIGNVMGKTWHEIESNIREIEAKKLMHIHEVSLSNDFFEDRYVVANATPDFIEGDFIWLNIKKYCELTGRCIVSFVECLDFSSLD